MVHTEIPPIISMIIFHDTKFLTAFWTLCTCGNPESACETVKTKIEIITDLNELWFSKYYDKK